jgi:hypothetical protein
MWRGRRDSIEGKRVFCVVLCVFGITNMDSFFYIEIIGQGGKREREKLEFN